MKISKDLFLSILSMDSYNRGHNAGIADEEGEADENGNDADGLGRLGARVGSATVIADNNLEEAQSAGFYALAYDIGADGPAGLAGTPVISYRGTDTSLDLSAGWSVGAGNIDDWTQAPLALELYTAVTGQSTRDGPASNVILTGHSLGGGLAA